MYSAEQGKLIAELVAGMSAEEAVARRDASGFAESFLSHVSVGDVNFYLDRLLTVAHRLELNREADRKAKKKALRALQDSVDACFFELMAMVREHLPASATMDLEMVPTKTRLDVYVKGVHARALIFDKEAMGLSTTIRGSVEDMSGWDTEVSGWDQSEAIRQFVAYVEGQKEKGTGC